MPDTRPNRVNIQTVLNGDDHYDAELIDYIKQQKHLKLWGQTFRRMVRLYAQLEHDNTDLLYELFPELKPAQHRPVTRAVNTEVKDAGDDLGYIRGLLKMMEDDK